MKTLYLLRHAKAPRHVPGVPDLGRPLKVKGVQQALSMAGQVASLLPAPGVVCCSPSLRTRQTLLPFHANLLQAAISAGAPVLPVGLRYLDSDTGQRSDAPLFIGDTTLLRSLWNTLRAKGVQAVVHYGQPQHDRGRDRRAWAKDLRGDVQRLLESGHPSPD